MYKVYPSKLEGIVQISGAKNSVLRLLAASILTDEAVQIKRYPSSILDAQVHVEMLKKLGKSIEFLDNDTIIIKENYKLLSVLDWNGRSIRNTLLILGALLARTGDAAVPLPGGCKLGDRKYDIHVNVLESFGAKVWEDNKYLYARGPIGGLIGNDIYLPIRSTGATENAIICATLAQGTTRIWNPHIRPEILDLISFLINMGAKIKVYGQEHIEIKGVEYLRGVSHTVIPDSMEAITWVIGSVITGGDIEIIDFPYKDLEVTMTHLESSGVKFYRHSNNLIVKGGNCYPIDIATGPHPGINSDIQPILAAFASQARGKSTIVDLRFPGRYGYAIEMAKMGLDYTIDGNMLKINGKGGNLFGAEVSALDLRAGASLLLTGLVSSGETIIQNSWQIERGYNDIINKLKKLGAEISVFDS